MELINIKDLIIELKKRNTDLGKGNPYNRLRYYTKIGWIDHMVRKKDSQGVVVGHYPIAVIEKIVEIENLKKMGKSNEEITTELKTKKIKGNESNIEILNKLKEKINLNVIIFILIIIGFIFELSNYNNKMPINQNVTNLAQNEIKIVDKGKNILPSGKNKIFINSKNINLKSIIIVTFDGSIEPATNYFISEKIIEEGFTIQTNLPLAKDVNFNWIIIN